MLKKREKLIIKSLLLLLVIGAIVVPTKIAFAVVQTTGSAVSVNQSDFTFDAKTGTITKYNGSKTNVVIPSKINGISVTSIGDYAFYNCSKLTSITIPNSVTIIGEDAFGYCSGLTSIEIPNSVISIKNSAFYFCSGIKSITIPDSVVSIGDIEFGWYNNLQQINVSNNNKNYTSVDGVLFNKSKTKLIQYPQGKTGTSYTIPSTVTSIGDYAFWGSSNLGSIIIPSSVKNIGQFAFEGCKNLINLSIPNSVESIGQSAFTDCDGLTSITIPNIIGFGTFQNCNELSSVTILDGVKSIEGYAFEQCFNLKSVTIPDSVASIEYGAFKECDNALFYVKSERVKQLLINIGVDKNKIILNGSTSTVKVTGVTLNKAADVLKVGVTDSLSATITPANAANKNVTWSTSNSKVATVDSVGKVTGVGAGTATITVTTADGKKTASCSVTVTSVFPVTGVTLNKITDALKVGITDGLSATVSPANATNKNVTWSTSNSKVAAVDKNGKVTAIGLGTAIITVTTADGNKTANCSVTVTNTLILTAPYTNLYKTASFDIPLIDPKYGKQATLAPNQTVTVVEQNGDWYNIKTWLGNAWINIKNPKGIIGVNGVTLNNKTLSVVKGKTATLTVVIAPSNASNKALTWKSNNTAVATVDSTGKVTGVAAGTATITCTSNDGSGKYAACTVTVTNPVAVTGVTLNSKTLSLVKGNTGVLTAVIAPSNADNKAIKWTSSNEKVVTVNNGVITAVSVGTAYITATTVDGNKIANCSITVTNPIDQVIFKDKNLEQAIRKTINKPTGILYKSDVINITKLISDNNGILSSNGLISNINGIENLTNLQYLDLGHNEIVDISALKGLTKLQTLNLNFNPISNVNKQSLKSALPKCTIYFS